VGVKVLTYSFVNLGSKWRGWSTPRLAALPTRKDPLPIVQEAGWAPGPVWRGAENLAPTGIRFLDRPARSRDTSLIILHLAFYTHSHSNTVRSLLMAQPGRNM